MANRIHEHTQPIKGNGGGSTWLHAGGLKNKMAYMPRLHWRRSMNLHLKERTVVVNEILTKKTMCAFSHIELEISNNSSKSLLEVFFSNKLQLVASIIYIMLYCFTKVEDLAHSCLVETKMLVVHKTWTTRVFVVV